MFNSLNSTKKDAKSLLYEKLQSEKSLCESFAKTINYQGIHCNFCLDIPEIIEKEKKKQERRNDIAKFTKLVTSDIENSSHNDLVKNLFQDKTILKEYEDEILKSLCSNQQLLNDLNII